MNAPSGSLAHRVGTLAVLLTFIATGLPSSAYALRAGLEGTTQHGLEEEFGVPASARSATPRAGAEEYILRLKEVLRQMKIQSDWLTSERLRALLKARNLTTKDVSRIFDGRVRGRLASQIADVVKIFKQGSDLATRPPAGPEGVARWIQEHVLPALKQLIVSDFTDFSGLQRAGDTLSAAERPAWATVVDQLQAFVRRSQAEGPSEEQALDLEIAFGMFHLLEERWLVPRRLLFKPPSGPTQMSHLLDQMALGRIEETQRVQLAGRSVPVYEIRPILTPPGGSRGGIASWVGAGEILLDRDAFQEMVRDPFRQPARLPSVSDAAYRRSGVPRQLVEALLQIYAMIRLRYPSEEKLRGPLREDTFYEEYRHGLDHIHLEIGAERRYVGKGNHFYNAFMTRQVFPRGMIRRIWDQQTGNNRNNFARGAYELSGQMTRGAVGPDPLFVLKSWLQTVFNTVAEHGFIEAHRGHYIAAVLGIKLLAEKRGVVAPGERMVLGTWWKTTYEQLASKVVALMEQDPKALRLALKAIYQREFVYPIDEPPFPEIQSDGTLLQRPATPQAGAEEATAGQVLVGPVAPNLLTGPIAALVDELVFGRNLGPLIVGVARPGYEPQTAVAALESPIRVSEMLRALDIAADAGESRWYARIDAMPNTPGSYLMITLVPTSRIGPDQMKDVIRDLLHHDHRARPTSIMVSNGPLDLQQIVSDDDPRNLEVDVEGFLDGLTPKTLLTVDRDPEVPNQLSIKVALTAPGAEGGLEEVEVVRAEALATRPLLAPLVAQLQASPEAAVLLRTVPVYRSTALVGAVDSLIRGRPENLRTVSMESRDRPEQTINIPTGAIVVYDSRQEETAPVVPNGVALVDWATVSTFDDFIKQALAGWTGLPVSAYQALSLPDGRTALFV